MKTYKIYTDGSANNLEVPYFGGWGYIIICDDEIMLQGSGSDIETTNNKMELTSIIKAIQQIPDNSTIEIYTDSKYCITVLDHNNKKYTKNSDLIDLFNNLIIYKQLNYTFNWVKGHNGNEYNELADKLANTAYTQARTNHLNLDKNDNKPQHNLTFRDRAIIAYAKAKSLEEFINLIDN